ncbi:MAG TPA: SCO family protein [Solirubrobacteraceae bacterium]|nr:SCO family protein [Solirubrobacteraceae bacterium]
MEHSLATDGLAHKVAIIEVTVDPGRDTPERMAAYAKLTGVSWPLLTAAPATIAALWHSSASTTRASARAHRPASTEKAGSQM